MPEYLSPGVFIEEIPARLKAIEGVSTSTAGFVGPSGRGPVAGGSPADGVAPLVGVVFPAGFRLPPDPTPVLVTSFAEYARQFGQPPIDPVASGYLGHSLRAFFDNGGKRCFLARVVGDNAARAFFRADRGSVLRLARRVRTTDATVFLTSLRGVDVTGTPGLSFRRISDGTEVLAGTIDGYDTQAASVHLTAAAGVDLDPTQIYVVPASVTISAGTGPLFIARSQGAWGANLKVQISCSDRAPVPVTGAIGNNAADMTDRIQVQSSSSFYRGAIVEIDRGGGNTERIYATVAEILPGNTLRLNPPAINDVATTGFVRVAEIDVTIQDSATGATETFRGLSWNHDADAQIRSRHYSTVINNRSSLLYVVPPWAGLGGVAETTDLDSQPMSRNGDLQGPTQAAERGNDGALPTDDQIVGTDNGPGQRTGIQSLQDIDDIRIIAAPGRFATTVQNALISQCERMRYRFAVLDGQDQPAPASVVNDMIRHRNDYDTSFAGLYVPWVQIGDGDRTLLLPPSGYVAGIYARVDNERGVWKAPANEVVRGITGLGSYITTGEQDLLNPRGINAIRRFEGRGIRVWGARTLSSDPEFRYINVRRFLIFLEASIDRGTQYVVFEPNAPETWSRVVDSISAFLNTQWRGGALFGRRPEDAFFVRCDETTMTVDDIQNGRLICNIGVAIVRPAEFVIFRIEQITGFGQQS